MQTTQPPVIAIQRFEGSACRAILPEVARIRIRLFKGHPYYYAGTLDYEMDYLKAMADYPQSLVILARHEEVVVGAATSLPLASEADILKETARAFEKAGIDPSTGYYYGEILVDPTVRNQGIARQFYRTRQGFAKAHGFSFVCFAAINNEGRSVPDTYYDPQPFWQKMGFTHYPEISFPYSWPTIQPDGSVVDQEHILSFWMKSI